MNEVKLELTVRIEEPVAPERVARVVEAIIFNGISVWRLISEGRVLMRIEGGDLEVARLASAMDILQPIVAKPSRVLVTVGGGLADYVSDGDVEIEIFDRDNFDDDPSYTRCPPKHFADLAEPIGVPVRGDERG